MNPPKLQPYPSGSRQRISGFDINNLQELNNYLLQKQKAHTRIGFRINPQVGAEPHGTMSTATVTSKFGVAPDNEATET